MSDTTEDDSTPEHPSKYRIHPDHNDPTATVILVSKDKWAFRVSKWYLKERSRLFADMIGSDMIKANLDGLEIELDASGNVVHCFLGFLYSNRKLTLHSTTFRELVELIELSRWMQVQQLDCYVEPFLNHRANLEPWAAFQYAAKTNDLVLARAAIEAFDKVDDGHHWPPLRLPDIDLQEWREVPLLWIIELHARQMEFRRPTERTTPTFRLAMARGVAQLLSKYRDKRRNPGAQTLKKRRGQIMRERSG